MKIIAADPTVHLFIWWLIALLGELRKKIKNTGVYAADYSKMNEAALA